MIKFLIFLSITLFSVVVVNAQSAEKISALLKIQQITKGQAAYLAATFKNLVGEDASEEDAFKILSENKYFSEKESCDELITLASMLRIPVNMHNVPEDRIFRPHSWAAFGTEDAQAADYRACQNYGPIYK